MKRNGMDSRYKTSACGGFYFHGGLEHSSKPRSWGPRDSSGVTTLKNLNIAILMASAGIFMIAPDATRAQDIERPTLTAEQCQPLSAENADICCIALNREQLLTAAEIDQCPPLTTAHIRDVLDDADQSVIPPAQTVVTDPTDGETAEEPGEETAGETAKPNSGAGNAGETGSGEQVSTDADPGSSGENNSAPDSPPGQ